MAAWEGPRDEAIAMQLGLQGPADEYYSDAVTVNAMQMQLNGLIMISHVHVYINHFI